MVETYVQKHNIELISDPAKLDAFKAQIDALELEGQKQLITDDKSPNPFTPLNESMERVFKTICPTVTKIESYSTEPIPPEILDLIALAKKENYFVEIEVWSDDKEPDPVVVGIVHRDGRSWDRMVYLIGRWGTELAPFVELKNMAIERITEKLKIEKQSCIAKIESVDPETHARGYISNIPSMANNLYVNL